MMQNGLEQLGIGVPVEVAGALLHMLGSDNAESFGARDIASLCARYGTSVGKLDETPLSSHHVTTRDLPAAGHQFHETVSTERMPAISDHGHGAVVDATMAECESVTSQVRETHTMTDGTKSSAKRTLVCNRSFKGLSVSHCPTQGEKFAVAQTRGVHSSWLPTFSTTSDSTLSTCPVQLHNMIDTLAVNESKQQQVTRRHPWDFLPYWARESSRQTLRELIHNHTR